MQSVSLYLRPSAFVCCLRYQIETLSNMPRGIMLSELPTGMITGILEQCDPPTLCVTSRVNKCFKEVSLQLLYQHIRFDCKRGIRWIQPWLLLRSVLVHPDLALKIRSLSFTTSDYCRHWDLDRFNPLELAKFNKGLQNLIRSIAQEIVIGDLWAEMWEEGLRDGRLHALLPVLLQYTQNLQTLQTQCTFECDWTLLKGMPHERSGALKLSECSPLLPRLEKFSSCKIQHFNRHNCDPYPYDYHWPLLVRFLHLPSINSLSFGHIYFDKREPPVELPSASSLKTLILAESQISVEDLQKLLKATPYLEKLGYTSHAMFTNAGEVFDPPRIGQSLELVQNTLRSLCLSAHFGLFWKVSTGLRKGIGSLQGLKKLETLEISLIAMLGLDCLHSPDLRLMFPQSLKCLSLLDDGHHYDYPEQAVAQANRSVPWGTSDGLHHLIYSSLLPLVAGNDTNNPNLKAIRLLSYELTGFQGVQDTDPWTELSHTFAHHGVNFLVTAPPPDGACSIEGPPKRPDLATLTYRSTPRDNLITLNQWFRESFRALKRYFARFINGYAW